MTSETEHLMKTLLEMAREEGIHLWGFSMDTFSEEIGQFGNFDPMLHFDNSIKALSVLGKRHQMALKAQAQKEN